jgi:hypothetical protein
MTFEILGQITNIETIAIGNAIRELSTLRQNYGHGRWRKLKGIAFIRLTNNSIRQAEIHWEVTNHESNNICNLYQSH